MLNDLVNSHYLQVPYIPYQQVGRIAHFIFRTEFGTDDDSLHILEINPPILYCEEKIFVDNLVGVCQR